MKVAEYRGLVGELGQAFASLQSAATPEEQKLRKALVRRAVTRLTHAECRGAKAQDLDLAGRLIDAARGAGVDF